jgi:Ca-activated chloride channel family protein
VVRSYKKDQNNETVITKLNKETLRLIANEAKGSYIDGSQTAAVVEQVRAILSVMDKKEFEAKEFAEYKDQFQWFLGIGLFFLILDVLLLERKTAWLKRLNLFNENL